MGRSMKIDDLILRCYAEKVKDGSWIAVCIDLDLIAQDDNLEFVRNKLHSMINEYLVTAFSTDKNYFQDLIPRRSPLPHRFKYYLIKFISKINHHVTPNHLFFNEPLPVYF